MPKNFQEVDLPQAIPASQEPAVNSADGDKDMRQKVDMEDDGGDVSEWEPQVPTGPRKRKPSEKALARAQDLGVRSAKRRKVPADEPPVASSSKQSDGDQPEGSRPRRRGNKVINANVTRPRKIRDSSPLRTQARSRAVAKTSKSRVPRRR
ncbi:hypothetical protein EW146_g8321 [Bondarzewia mesenterica]|uniref:Uncharacterized protein n=1 Tax=Bondarzewia mesenterica TaxID=1095465 RepID=A0A4S4LKV4_9AGAM|nr:hypothetical protein EW146_g8321 [Bondarzewia mesenterica]